MEFGKFIIVPCAILLTATIFAEENMQRSFFGSFLNSSHLFDPPSNSQNASNASHFDGVKNFTNDFFPLRMKRSVGVHNNDEEHPEKYSEKLDDPSKTNNCNLQIGSSVKPGASSSLLDFEQLLPIIDKVACNYTKPGSTCHSCREIITCKSDNKAVIRKCILLQPFCNGGSCSLIPGDLCFEKPATTTSASISTSTSSPSTSAAITPSTTTPTISSTKSTISTSPRSIASSSAASITPNVAAT